MSFYSELKRRNVLRAAAAYVVSSWLLIQVAETVFPLFGYDDAPARIIVILLSVGFIPTMVISWAFELTSEGFHKDSDVSRTPSESDRSSKRFDRALMMILAMGLAYFAFDKFILSESRELAIAESARDEALAEAQQTTIDSQSVAVLPFVNMSSDPENDFLSYGITEEILSLLANVPGLRVPARTSSFAFRGTSTDIKEIGKLLGVGTVLEGTVQRAGDQLRITAQLVNISDGYQLWGEKYDRKMTNIFDIQDDIARNIVSRLELTFAASDSNSSSSHRVDDVAAYELFLKGRFYADKYSEPELRQAINYFEQALLRQPDFARAYAGLAYAYGSLRYFGHVPPGSVTAQYREAVSRAIELDPMLAEAHFSLGLLRYNVDWDWAASERAFQRAIELDPSNVWAHGLYAFVLATMGRFEEALAEANMARELDPLSVNASVQPGWIYFFQGDYGKAVEFARRAVDVEPDFVNAHELLGYALFRMGDRDGGISALEKAVSIADFPIVLGNLGWMYARVGREDDAQKVLHELLTRAERQYVPSMSIAYVYRGLEDHENANVWMTKAINDREGILVLFKIGFGSDDELDRRNPYYSRWLTEIGLSEF